MLLTDSVYTKSGKISGPLTQGLSDLTPVLVCRPSICDRTLRGIFGRLGFRQCAPSVTFIKEYVSLSRLYPHTTSRVAHSSYRSSDWMNEKTLGGRPFLCSRRRRKRLMSPPVYSRSPRRDRWF